MRFELSILRVKRSSYLSRPREWTLIRIGQSFKKHLSTCLITYWCTSLILNPMNRPSHVSKFHNLFINSWHQLLQRLRSKHFGIVNLILLDCLFQIPMRVRALQRNRVRVVGGVAAPWGLDYLLNLLLNSIGVRLHPNISLVAIRAFNVVASEILNIVLCPIPQVRVGLKRLSLRAFDCLSYRENVIVTSGWLRGR